MCLHCSELTSMDIATKLVQRHRSGAEEPHLHRRRVCCLPRGQPPLVLPLRHDPPVLRRLLCAALRLRCSLHLVLVLHLLQLAQLVHALLLGCALQLVQTPDCAQQKSCQPAVRENPNQTCVLRAVELGPMNIRESQLVVAQPAVRREAEPCSRCTHRVYRCSGALCALVMLLPPESSEVSDLPAAQPDDTMVVHVANDSSCGCRN